MVRGGETSPDRDEGAISVIVPSRAEGRTLVAGLEALANVPGLDEVIVVAESESAATREAATSALPGLRWLEALRAGRGPQLAQGAAAARGGVLVLLHADTRLPGDAAGLIREALERPGVAGGAFRLGFDVAHPVLDLLTALSALPAHWAVFGDQAMFCTRAAYRGAGGCPDTALFEDVDLAWALVRQGRLVRLRARVTTSSRRFVAAGPARQLAHNAALLTLHYLGVPARRLAARYDP